MGNVNIQAGSAKSGDGGTSRGGDVEANITSTDGSEVTSEQAGQSGGRSGLVWVFLSLVVVAVLIMAGFSEQLMGILQYLK